MAIDVAALEAAVDLAIGRIREAPTLDELARIESDSMGRRSDLAAANHSLRDLDESERPRVGRAIGDLRRKIADAVERRRRELAEEIESRRVAEGSIDVSLPGVKSRQGHEHLLSRVAREITDIFIGMGYRVADGNEVETDYYNFEALNIPKNHPARSMQDTLYVDSGENEEILLRTQTSGVQIHYMEATKPPLYMVAPGRVFRRETLDPSHSPVFHQIEGLAVDKGLSLANLAGTLRAFFNEYFGEGRRIRMRPSFFPFTEPSVEVAMSCYACDGGGCRTCGHAGWLELLGAGMVDPNVLTNVGIDPEEWSGFAFGIGIDRIAMMRYAIPDIRILFENDIRFLSQF